MITIHLEQDDNRVSISEHEWKMILAKLEEVEQVRIISQKKPVKNQPLAGKGYFQKYSNASLIAEENKAWGDAVKDKHSDHS